VQSGFYPLVTGKFRTVFHLMVPFHGFPLRSFLQWPEQDTYLRGMAELVPARPTPWKTIILLCGKCARKMDGGYGPKGKETLRTALRDVFRERGQRGEVRIIETRCMGICPWKAVTALNASRPDTILTIPKGTATNEAIMQLMHEAEQ
jgi:hypothetical protein